MRFAIIISALLHVAFVGVWFVIPDSWKPTFDTTPIVPIEVISEAELSDRLSVPETRREPEPEEIEAPAPEEQPEEAEPQPQPDTVQPEPQPEEQQPEPEPIQLPEEPTEEPEPVEEEPEPVEEEPEPEPEPEPQRPEPKPEPEPEPRTNELDLASLESALEDLDREETNAPQEAPTETGQAQQGERDQNQVGLGDRLTATEEAKVRAHLARCWNLSSTAGAPEPEKLIVRVNFKLNRDGSLASEPRVLNSLQINTSGNPFWKVAEREALNAVRRCAPYDFLPQDRYQNWNEFILNFNPAQMAGVY